MPPLSYIYWIILIIWFLFGGYFFWSVPADRRYAPHGFVLFVLFIIIGLQVFG